MTAVARHFLMLSCQPEFGFVVIETSTTPGLLRMTVGTFFSQPAKMRLVFFMTIDAAGRCFPVLFTGSMAVPTLDGTMLAFENEVRGFMTESFQVQLNNVRSPPFVIRVAMLALTSLHFGVAAMKPSLLFEVNAHRLVARHTLFVLPTFFKQYVALGALRFVFGVTFDHRPRHQKLLIRISICLQR